MSSKEYILNSIREHTTERFPKPDLTALEAEAITYTDPMQQFSAVMKQVGGQAVCPAEGQTAGEAIATLYPEAQRTALAVATLDGRESLPGNVFNPDEVATHQELTGTDLAIVEGKFGVCENGCVWLEDTVVHRALFFIPESLVIIIHRTDFVNNMHEAYRRIGDTRCSFGIFISGPSKTADIEQALVLGAHGAHSTTVLVVT